MTGWDFLELLVLLLTYFFRSKSNQIYLNFQSFPVDMLSNNWQKFSYIPQGKSTQRFQCFLQQKKRKRNWNYQLQAQRGKSIFEIVIFKYVNNAYSIKPNMNSLEVNILLVLDRMKNIQNKLVIKKKTEMQLHKYLYNSLWTQSLDIL